MVARRDCQKVLLRRPFVGFAVWLAWPAITRSRDSVPWAGARDPAKLDSQPAESRLVTPT